MKPLNCVETTNDQRNNTIDANSKMLLPPLTANKFKNKDIVEMVGDEKDKVNNNASISMDAN